MLNIEQVRNICTEFVHLRLILVSLTEVQVIIRLLHIIATTGTRAQLLNEIPLAAVVVFVELTVFSL